MKYFPRFPLCYFHSLNVWTVQVFSVYFFLNFISRSLDIDKVEKNGKKLNDKWITKKKIRKSISVDFNKFQLIGMSKMQNGYRVFIVYSLDCEIKIQFSYFVSFSFKSLWTLVLFHASHTAFWNPVAIHCDAISKRN